VAATHKCGGAGCRGGAGHQVPLQVPNVEVARKGVGRGGAQGAGVDDGQGLGLTGGKEMPNTRGGGGDAVAMLRDGSVIRGSSPRAVTEVHVLLLVLLSSSKGQEG